MCRHLVTQTTPEAAGAGEFDFLMDFCENSGSTSTYNLLFMLNLVGVVCSAV